MSSLDPIKNKIDEIRSLVSRLETHTSGLNEEQRKKHNTIISISDIISITTLLEEYNNILKSYKPLPFEQSFHIGKPEPNYVTKEDLTIQLETINTHITYLSKSLDELSRELKD